MLVSCSYCNGLHARGFKCANKPRDNRKKEETYITRFRSSKLWHNKRNEIKALDKFLCRTCFEKGTYVWQKLEVHHIRRISEKWNKRLDNENLITLCVHCHKMADNGNIEIDYLLELARKRGSVLKA